MMAAETCRACVSGTGPSETTQAPMAMVTKAVSVNAMAAKRMKRDFLAPSRPGLSRPSTSALSAETKAADARAIGAKTRSALLPDHEERLLLPDALISPDAPRPHRCR